MRYSALYSSLIAEIGNLLESFVILWYLFYVQFCRLIDWVWYFIVFLWIARIFPMGHYKMQNDCNRNYKANAMNYWIRIWSTRVDFQFLWCCNSSIFTCFTFLLKLWNSCSIKTVKIKNWIILGGPWMHDGLIQAFERQALVNNVMSLICDLSAFLKATKLQRARVDIQKVKSIQ